MSGRGHRLIDHTADVALEIWASDEIGLLIEGGRAILAILTEGGRIESRAIRRVQIEALDREDRLVAWLNEVLVLATSEGFLMADAAIVLSPNGLSAELTGEDRALQRIRTELKSVTYHDLVVVEDSFGFRARVVIDV